MVLACAPAIATLLLGTRLVAARGSDARLFVVGAGLATLMAMRCLTIFLPFLCKWGPFEKLAEQQA